MITIIITIIVVIISRLIAWLKVTEINSCLIFNHRALIKLIEYSAPSLFIHHS